MGTGGKAAGA